VSWLCLKEVCNVTKRHTLFARSHTQDEELLKLHYHYVLYMYNVHMEFTKTFEAFIPLLYHLPVPMQNLFVDKKEGLLYII